MPRFVFFNAFLYFCNMGLILNKRKAFNKMRDKLQDELASLKTSYIEEAKSVNELFLKTPLYASIYDNLFRWGAESYYDWNYHTHNTYKENIDSLKKLYNKRTEDILYFRKMLYNWEKEYKENKDQFAEFVKNPSKFYVRRLLGEKYENYCFSSAFYSPNDESFTCAEFTMGRDVPQEMEITNYTYSVRPMTEDEFNKFLTKAVANESHNAKEADELTDYFRNLFYNKK